MTGKNTLRFLVALLIIVTALTSCNSKKQLRPRDPWVFRSVLDNKPRMITAALHDDMYVAYSAQTCQLYKA